MQAFFHLSPGKFHTIAWKWHSVDTSCTGGNNDPLRNAEYLNDKGGFAGLIVKLEVILLMLDYFSDCGVIMRDFRRGQKER